MGKASKKTPSEPPPGVLRTNFPLLAADVNSSGSLLIVGGGGGGGNNGVPNALKVCSLTEDDGIEEVAHCNTASSAVTSLSVDPAGRHVACILGQDVMIYTLEDAKQKVGASERAAAEAEPAVKLVEAQRISLKNTLSREGASTADALRPYCLKLGGRALPKPSKEDAPGKSLTILSHLPEPTPPPPPRMATPHLFPPIHHRPLPNFLRAAGSVAPGESFCPLLAVGMEDGGLVLFKRESEGGAFSYLWRERQHQKDLKQIAFSANGELVATAAADNKCLLWTIGEGGQLQGTPKEVSKAPLGGKAADKGQWRTLSLVQEEPKSTRPMFAAVNATPRGPGLAVGCCTLSGTITNHTQVASSPITAMGASPDGGLLAYGDSEGTVVFVHGETLQQVLKVPVHRGWFITRVLVARVDNSAAADEGANVGSRLKLITCAGDNTVRLIVPSKMAGFDLALMMISHGVALKRFFLGSFGAILAFFIIFFFPQSSEIAWAYLTGAPPRAAPAIDEWASAAKGPDLMNAGDGLLV